MATSKVEIASGALALLGADPITSLTDASTQAQSVALIYPVTLKALLRMRRWNFALKRATLARLTTAPTWGWDYAYQLPTDCLKVWEMEHEATYPYKIEGRTLVTNLDAANILYTYYCDSPTLYDATFIHCFQALLARDLAWSITQNRGLIADMDKLFRDALREAATADGMEGTGDDTGVQDLITVRL